MLALSNLAAVAWGHAAAQTPQAIRLTDMAAPAGVPVAQAPMLQAPLPEASTLPAPLMGPEAYGAPVGCDEAGLGIGCDASGVGCLGGSCLGKAGSGNWLSDAWAQLRCRFGSGACGGACGPQGCQHGGRCGLFGLGCCGYGHPGCGVYDGPCGRGGCCATRWFDFHAEWMYLYRDDVGDRIDIASDGVLGPVVLDTDDMDFDPSSGFRVTWAYLIGPGTNLELGYFGTFNWDAAAAATSSQNNLFSVFSEFGSDPLLGFPETDRAYLQQIAYSSQLNNGELNLRHRWISANCLLHGSWLLGARYVALDEDFTYNTRTNVGLLDYQVETENDLIGAQIGGDLFLCITPRFKVGGEAKAGIYGLRARQTTDVYDDLGGVLFEQETDDDVAFVGEVGAIGIFRLTPRCSLRGGFQMLYLDEVALASENFNTQSPFSIRESFIDTGGDVFYYGGTLGFEWMW
jgi:hypothetical protein